MSRYLLGFLLLFSACGSDTGTNPAFQGSGTAPQEEEIDLEFFTNRNSVIWGFSFLSENRIIFTERDGGIFILDRETEIITQVSGVPEVSVGGEGGMLDLKLHPEFPSNEEVYFCYTKSQDEGRAISVAKGRLTGTNLSSVQTIFTSNRSNDSFIHFGCRIEFQDPNSFFLSIGDQNAPEESQNPDSHLGKILLISDDGLSISIYSLGHRNVQGLAERPETGELYASEHGPIGGDEINLIEQGNNYGWPLLTSGEPPGPLGDSAEGFIDPLSSYSPAIAPSGMTFYTGSQIPGWSGDLFIATLRGNHLRRIRLSGTEVVSEEELFENHGIRFRNVEEGPDGYLWFSTDDGRIGRVIRAN